MVLRTRAEEAETNAITMEAALLVRREGRGRRAGGRQAGGMAGLEALCPEPGKPSVAGGGSALLMVLRLTLVRLPPPHPPPPQNAKDQFVRMSADFDNFRKRSASEKSALAASVKGDTVMTLVPLVDNFELAKASIKVESEGEARIDTAYQGLYKQMVELFRGLGLEAVPGVGAPFDPELHEAIMREPSDDVPDGTVLEEFRKGFSLGGKLLRPAMVKVSFSEAPAPAAAEAEPAAASE